MQPMQLPERASPAPAATQKATTHLANESKPVPSTMNTDRKPDLTRARLNVNVNVFQV